MRRLASGLLLLVACHGLAACHAKPSPRSEAAAPDAAAEASVTAAAPAPEDAGARVWPVWTAKITNDEEFDHYATHVGDDEFVKLVVDLHSKATFYADADLYPMHKDFIFAELLKKPRTPEAVHDFDRNYGKNKPDFLMLYVVHHQRQDVWSFAFWEGDKATAAHVRQARESLQATFHRAALLKFRPCSNDQEAVAKELAGEIPWISNDALFKALAYQGFHPGVAVGKLRIVRGDPSRATFAQDEIVILPEPLSDITPVAGILSGSHSTPLSHVNLRAAGWDVPNAALLDAAKTYAALDGKVVRYEAGATGADMRLATPEEVAAQRSRTTARTTVQVPRANLEASAFAMLSELHARDAAGYGQKTANLGEIVSSKLEGVHVPPGFGIPIRAYARHLEANGISAEIDALLADPKLKTSAPARRQALEHLRTRIRSAPLAPDFEAALQAALGRLGGVADAGPAPGLFVRSSTNAEDLKGFSGAGLYDTVPNVRGAAAVGEAVKQVWASVWSFGAYEERELYRIDQHAVYGAVLVQIGVPATAAGVLVTAHPTDAKDTHTITINAKSGLGMRVVDGKKVPEIVLFNTFNRGLRVVSRSDEATMLVFSPDGGVREVANANEAAPVLTNARVAKLADAATKLRGVFPRDRPLDIEWVFLGEDLFIVQSRPFMGAPGP